MKTISTIIAILMLGGIAPAQIDTLTIYTGTGRFSIAQDAMTLHSWISSSDHNLTITFDDREAKLVDINTGRLLAGRMETEEVETQELKTALADMLNEYYTECYNDSSRTNDHIAPSGGSCAGYDMPSETGGWYFYCTNKEHYHDVTHHRTPTFDGFYRWLKQHNKK